MNAIFRIDPVTGALHTVSSDTIGSGAPLAQAGHLAVESDGSLLVTVRPTGQPGVVRVDPSSGDRAVVSDAVTGGGPLFQSHLSALAVGADGSIFVGDPQLQTNEVDRILRIDPATGERTILSGASAGEGRRLGAPRGLAVEADGTLVAYDSPHDVFCVPVCPHPLCVLCLRTSGSVVRIDPVSGDRTLVSGGGTCFAAAAGCATPYFGRIGRGPTLGDPGGIAVESAESFIVGSASRVLRVDTETGDRQALTRFLPTSSSANPRALRRQHLRRLSGHDAGRVYRPRDAAAWLRHAIGDEFGDVDVRRPQELFRGLSADRRRALGERLYAAVWKTMGEVLGFDHLDTLAAARPSP